MITRRKFFSAPLAVPGLVAAAAAPAVAMGVDMASEPDVTTVKIVMSTDDMDKHLEQFRGVILNNIERQFGRISRDHALKRG